VESLPGILQPNGVRLKNEKKRADKIPRTEAKISVLTGSRKAELRFSGCRACGAVCSRVSSDLDGYREVAQCYKCGDVFW
jgi:uncharacterized protein with PIN domain